LYHFHHDLISWIYNWFFKAYWVKRLLYGQLSYLQWIRNLEKSLSFKNFKPKIFLKKVSCGLGSLQFTSPQLNIFQFIEGQVEKGWMIIEVTNNRCAGYVFNGEWMVFKWTSATMWIRSVNNHNYHNYFIHSNDLH